MRYEYVHLDVFADRVFSGNQLAVFPEASGLDPHRMQQIAAEMAFSETSFVFPPDAGDTQARVRIFTPARELPMAGHPTIGTAFALASEQRVAAGTQAITFGLGVGPVRVALEWRSETLRFAWMTQRAPTFGSAHVNVATLASALGVHETDVRESGLPVQEVSSGVPFLFVPLSTRAAVNDAHVDRSTLQAFFAHSDLPELPVFVFSLEPGIDDATAFSRMFAPVFGIPEDPATGGACGPLGGYLVHHGVVSSRQAQRMVSLQGVAMGRPSRIEISVDTNHGVVSEVRVGGACAMVGRGFIEVPAGSPRSATSTGSG